MRTKRSDKSLESILVSLNFLPVNHCVPLPECARSSTTKTCLQFHYIDTKRHTLKGNSLSRQLSYRREIPLRKYNSVWKKILSLLYLESGSLSECENVWWYFLTTFYLPSYWNCIFVINIYKYFFYIFWLESESYPRSLVHGLSLGWYSLVLKPIKFLDDCLFLLIFFLLVSVEEDRRIIKRSLYLHFYCYEEINGKHRVCQAFLWFVLCFYIFIGFRTHYETFTLIATLSAIKTTVFFFLWVSGILMTVKVLLIYWRECRSFYGRFFVFFFCCCLLTSGRTSFL